MPDPLQGDIEAEVERLGFELVELERAGSKTRPILRLRIDLPESDAAQGVTLDDCVFVSRGLEEFLDQRSDVSERYVLEVSSPGVERPLVRRRDFERFAGREVVVLGREAIHGVAKRVTGELVGIEGPEGAESVRIKLKSGEVLEVSRDLTKKIHLVYRWGAEGR